MKVTKKIFGLLSNGKKVFLYTLKAGDLTLSLSSFGATWTSLLVPSHKGGKPDVLLGFSGFDGYLNNGPYMGVTVGRFANRIGGGCFSLNGKTYQLEKNDGQNTLHSGRRAFAKTLWRSESYEEKGGVYVRFELDSPDGDCGFPGNVRAAATYGLTKSNEVVAIYEAKADTPTPINLTNHAYFNLAGEGNGNILSHEVRLDSSSYLEVDDSLIPTGRLLPVRGGAFDFRQQKPVKQDLKSEYGGSGGSDAPDGYDHCFIVDGDRGKLRSCAEVREPDSGLTMKVFTTQPGVQFYTGNMLTDIPGKAGSVYAKHSGFCLETQHFPDSPNKPDFPSCVFGPDRDYCEKSVFGFDLE
ncbi:MAG: galactose mutarotase [Treponema sp.]|jgi:aldose 1-epimerase|nr:galactose mutarotase [Treponema sp.]